MSARTVVSNVAALSQFTAADGGMIASVIRSGGGYRFVEERELWEPPSNGLSGYKYWAETQQSGIYASQDEALLAARAAIGWLAGRGAEAGVP
jgi:hypothetical protein